MSAASFELLFTVFFACTSLLSFPVSAFTSYEAPVAQLPRMLLVHHGRPNLLPVQQARPPSYETNSSLLIDKTHGLLVKATTIKAPLPSSSSSCKQTYGLMPCTHSIVGGIFLLFAYSYIIYRAAKLMVQGSELLLLVLGSSIVGGLLLPVLGVLPDSILVLVSGMGGTKEEAQREVLIGIGLLAGSNIMLLTLLWGTCLILGRCDLTRDENQNLHANDNTLNKKFDLIGTGVEIDRSTRLSGGIMCISIIPLLVVQVPNMVHSTKASNAPALIACVLSFSAFIIYCGYQVMVPLYTKKLKLKALHDVIFYKLLKLKKVEEQLVDKNGNVNEDVLSEMFDKMDSNSDGALTRDEVHAILKINFVNKKLNENVLDLFMRDLDTNTNATLSREEFLNGMKRWCKDMKPTHIYFLEAQDSIKMENLQNELQEIMASKEETSSPTKPRLILKSTMLIIAGTVLVSLFAEPLVDAVGEFALSSHIPPFFVSFVLLPLASNTSESISSIIFSSRKKKVNMSLTYSQIYGAVTLNNTLSLGILLAIIYFRHLRWEFSSEVLIILMVTLVIGAIACIYRVLPLWIAILALLLYPLSLGIVAILDYVVGWT